MGRIRREGGGIRAAGEGHVPGRGGVMIVLLSRVIPEEREATKHGKYV